MKKKKQTLKSAYILVIKNYQRRGFEPLNPEGLPGYKAGAIDHSATFPIQRYNLILNIQL